MSKAERQKRKRVRRAQKRREVLASTPTKGWHQCSEYHFQKVIRGKLVNWWPGTHKCMIDNQVYRVFGESDMQDIIGIPAPSGAHK